MVERQNILSNLSILSQINSFMHKLGRQFLYGKPSANWVTLLIRPVLLVFVRRIISDRKLLSLLYAITLTSMKLRSISDDFNNKQSSHCLAFNSGEGEDNKSNKLNSKDSITDRQTTSLLL